MKVLLNLWKQKNTSLSSMPLLLQVWASKQQQHHLLACWKYILLGLINNCWVRIWILTKSLVCTLKLEMYYYRLHRQLLLPLSPGKKNIKLLSYQKIGYFGMELYFWMVAIWLAVRSSHLLSTGWHWPSPVSLDVWFLGFGHPRNDWGNSCFFLLT